MGVDMYFSKNPDSFVGTPILSFRNNKIANIDGFSHYKLNGMTPKEVMFCLLDLIRELRTPIPAPTIQDAWDEQEDENDYEYGTQYPMTRDEMECALECVNERFQEMLQENASANLRRVEKIPEICEVIAEIGKETYLSDDIATVG